MSLMASLFIDNYLLNSFLPYSEESIESDALFNINL